ncbi:hypothetical protein BZK31_02035 [Pseudomonas floridensis]|uniref:Uncharacterized protein n=1 Tax=Pseudomonas floridensis TaxID=1958950 RepID=A0A1X0NBT4_9PSED|nr:hypothetical protein BZK31_02035 [Pseudomonas floridensis]
MWDADLSAKALYQALPLGWMYGPFRGQVHSHVGTRFHVGCGLVREGSVSGAASGLDVWAFS